MKTRGHGGSRPTSHVGIVDKSYGNMYRCHSDLIKSNLTLKDRSALNLKAFDSDFVFGRKG